MIRFIIDIVSSAVDVNGNTYHFAHVKSTKTGRSLAIVHLGAPSNATYRVMKALDLEWEHIHYTESRLPIRKFKRALKVAKAGDDATLYHHLTAEMLTALETA